MRVKPSVPSRKKRKKVLARAKGFAAPRRKAYRKAKETLLKAGSHAYRGRKERKRNFRRLWITRLSAAVSEYGLNYSQLVKKQKEKNIAIDRKILSDIALTDPQTFGKIIESIKK